MTTTIINDESTIIFPESNIKLIMIAIIMAIILLKIQNVI